MSSNTRTQNRLDGRGKRPRPAAGRRQGTRRAIVAHAVREAI